MSVIEKDTLRKMGDHEDKRPKYRVTEKFCELLKAEMLQVSPVAKTQYFGSWYDCIIGVGSDYTATLKVPEETILANPEYFEEVGVAGTSEEEAE